MKTSTYSKAIIGSCLNDYLVDHTSFCLIRDVCSMPPAQVTICEGGVTYEVPPHQVVQGNPQNHYYCDTDYEGLTADCRTVSTFLREKFTFNKHRLSFRAHLLTIFDDVVKTEPFKLKRDATHGDVEIITLDRVVKFQYNSHDVEVLFHEVWTTPLHDGVDLFFPGPPYYHIEILMPQNTPTSTFQSLIHHLIPRGMLHDLDSAKTKQG